jgi:ABC-type nitrate/sulfonate/bicarbonate transport system permease component
VTAAALAHRTRATLLPGLPPILACFALLLAWQLYARTLSVGGIPDALSTIRELPAILGDRESLVDILDSIRRMTIGFVVALAISVPLGLFMGRSRIVAALVNPLLMITYPVPKAALMPIIMLWLGVGDASKLLVIVLGVSLPVIYHAYQGARSVEEKMLWSARAMGMSGPARLARIVLPASLPEILVGCRTGIVLALITMITSEMIARQTGAGNILFSALDMAQYETVYAMILVISALGILLDVLFERVRGWLTGWAEPRHELVAAPL